MTYPFRDELAEANDSAFFPIEYLDQTIADGTSQYWGTPNAAMVTQIVNYPGGAKVVRSLATTGDLKEITEIIAPQIETWAIENGCTHLLVEGRDGWKRALKPLGYEPYQTVILKVL